MTFNVCSLSFALLLQRNLSFIKFTLFRLLLGPDFLLLRLKLLLEVLIVDLELVELVLISLLVRLVPIVLGLTINHRIYK